MSAETPHSPTSRRAPAVRRLLLYLSVLFAVLVIVAAIAVPYYLGSHMAGGGNPGASGIRTINTAVVTYASTYSNGFPLTLEAMAWQPGARSDCNHAQLIDSALAGGHRAGYVLTYTPKFPAGSKKRVLSREAAAAGCTVPGATGYSATADPMDPAISGQNHFFTDETGVVRVEIGKPATASSPPAE